MDPDRTAVAAQLERLRFELSGPESGPLRAERDRIVRAIRSLDARAVEPRAPLLAVVGGGSGAGKSTTVNSLADATVTRAGVVRPTTRTPTLVCHPDDRAWFVDDRVLPDLTRVDAAAADAGGRAVRLVTSTALPAGLAVLDTPDIDSVELDNHRLADEVLDAADVWVWLATARTYADEVGMSYLRRASARQALAAVVITQVREDDRDEVLADVDRLLATEGVQPDARLVIPHDRVEDGRLPPGRVQGLRDWLADLAPTDRRVDIRTRAVDGLERALPGEIVPTFAAVQRERAAAERLQGLVADRYAAIGARFEAELDEGVALRADVLERWGAMVGGNETMARVQTAIGQVGDLVRTRLGRGAPQDTREVQVEVAGELTRIVARLLDQTRRALRRDLEADPAGRLVLQHHPHLRDQDPDREAEVREVVAAWETFVSERIEHVGGPRMARARRRSTALNAVATSAILVLFTLSGGLTGGEVGIAALAAATSQWLLVRMLGEKNVRQLMEEIGTDLTRRVRDLAAVDRAVVEEAIATSAPSPTAVEVLRTATGARP